MIVLTKVLSAPSDGGDGVDEASNAALLGPNVPVSSVFVVVFSFISEATFLLDRLLKTVQQDRGVLLLKQ